MSEIELGGGYPPYMRKLIRRVEESRPRRMTEERERIPLEQRKELLGKYHPDYRPGTKRAIRVGPNTGDIAPNEVVDLTEAHPLVTPEEIDLSRVDYDVDILIIGAGGAGTTAALWALQEGVTPDSILIATKLRGGDSNSMMSQGGVQAADRDVDSPTRHYIDVMGGGHFTNERALVKPFVTHAPRMIAWLESLGVIFDKHDDGEMIEIPGGGTTANRMHSCRDYTGMEIMRNMIDRAQNLEIPVLEFSPTVELIMDEGGQAAGAILLNLENREYYVARAKSTILATGGFGRLHLQDFPTTNHYGATADGLVLAYRVGARLRDMDATQYHPTGAAYPEQIVGLLCTEKLRGMGAQVVNKDGQQFVYPLEPRDVEASAIIRECSERGNGVQTPTGMTGVWEDTPLIEEINGPGTIQKRFPYMFRLYARFGIDITKDPILVFPTLHYQNGGVAMDENGQTQVPGLFAAGEVGGGLHGKNRLMGNSIMDYLVFGRIAGINAAKHARDTNLGKLTLEHVVQYEAMLKEAGIETDRRAPLLLPDYRGEKVVKRTLDVFTL